MMALAQSWDRNIVGVQFGGGLWCSITMTRPQGGGLTTQADVSFPFVPGGNTPIPLLDGEEVAAPFLTTPHTLLAGDLSHLLVGGSLKLVGFRLKALVEPSIGSGSLFFKLAGNQSLKGPEVIVRTVINMSPLSTTSLTIALYKGMVKVGAALVGDFDGGLIHAAQTPQQFYDGVDSPITVDCKINTKTTNLTLL